MLDIFIKLIFEGGHFKKMIEDLVPGSIFFIAFLSVASMVWGKLKSRIWLIYAGWTFLNIELFILLCMIINEIINVSLKLMLIKAIIIILPLASFSIVKRARKIFVKLFGFTLLNFELLAILIIFCKKIFQK